MFPFTIFKRSATDVGHIRALEAENDRLCNENAQLRTELSKLEKWKKRRERRELKQRVGRDNQKALKQFVGYKNNLKVDRRFWPKVMCIECSHLIENRTHKRCSLHGFPVGKFGSCENAFPKRVNLEEKKTA